MTHECALCMSELYSVFSVIGGGLFAFMQWYELRSLLKTTLWLWNVEHL